MSDEPVSMLCAKCGRVLDFYESYDDPSLSRYRHTAQDMADQDHEAEPMPAEFVADPRYRCDFCNADTAPGLNWVIPVTTFAVGPGNYSEGSWAACETCTALIREDRWDDLITRASHGSPLNSIMLMPLYRELRKHITGPPYQEKI
jgi:hypothetical protein